MFVNLVVLKFLRNFQNNSVFFFLTLILEAITRKLLNMFMLNETFSSSCNNRNTHNPPEVFLSVLSKLFGPLEGEVL